MTIWTINMSNDFHEIKINTERQQLHTNDYNILLLSFQQEHTRMQHHFLLCQNFHFSQSKLYNIRHRSLGKPTLWSGICLRWYPIFHIYLPCRKLIASLIRNFWSGLYLQVQNESVTRPSTDLTIIRIKLLWVSSANYRWELKFNVSGIGLGGVDKLVDQRHFVFFYIRVRCLFIVWKLLSLRKTIYLRKLLKNFVKLFWRSFHSGRLINPKNSRIRYESADNRKCISWYLMERSSFFLSNIVSEWTMTLHWNRQVIDRTPWRLARARLVHCLRENIRVLFWFKRRIPPPPPDLWLRIQHNRRCSF